MDVDKRRVVQARKVALQGNAEILASALPVPADQGIGQEPDGQQIVEQAKRLDHLDRVGRHLDAGAHLAKSGCPLEQPDLHAALQQADGEGGPADAAAADADPERSVHARRLRHFGHAQHLRPPPPIPQPWSASEASRASRLVRIVRDNWPAPTG
jgi:hypothetical protein